MNKKYKKSSYLPLSILLLALVSTTFSAHAETLSPELVRLHDKIKASVAPQAGTYPLFVQITVKHVSRSQLFAQKFGIGDAQPSQKGYVLQLCLTDKPVE